MSNGQSVPPPPSPLFMGRLQNGRRIGHPFLGGVRKWMSNGRPFPDPHPTSILHRFPGKMDVKMDVPPFSEPPP